MAQFTVSPQLSSTLISLMNSSRFPYSHLVLPILHRVSVGFAVLGISKTGEVAIAVACWGNIIVPGVVEKNRRTFGASGAMGLNGSSMNIQLPSEALVVVNVQSLVSPFPSS